MAEERPKFQSVEEWMVATQEKFEEPTISLKNYGGEKLDLLAQFPVRISQNDYQVDVKVLVRKGAPNPLTDAQPGLGFRLVKKESGSDGVDLVTGERVNVKSSNPEEPPQKCLEPVSPEPKEDKECTPTSGVVCLLNATSRF